MEMIIVSKVQGTEDQAQEALDLIHEAVVTISQKSNASVEISSIDS